MEVFELKYFLAAAAHQNLSRAAKQVSVSIPAVSRAISKLEEELGTKMFVRVGRNIQLSQAGRQLQQDASRIIGMMEDVRSKFRPSQSSVPISICGTEFGISMFLSEVVRRLKVSCTEFTIDVRVLPNSKRVKQALVDGESQLGIVSGVPHFQRLASVTLGKFISKTLVGDGHPLFKAAKAKKGVPIEEVLRHEFVSFTEALLGDQHSHSELQDGWRDDKFARKIGLKTESVEIALRLVESGHYLGYLPFELTRGRSTIETLKTSGCPYSCTTECHLLGVDPDEYSWMKRLFAVRR